MYLRLLLFLLLVVLLFTRLLVCRLVQGTFRGLCRYRCRRWLWRLDHSARRIHHGLDLRDFIFDCLAGALGSFVLKALWDAMTQLRLDNATLVKQIGELSDKIGREYVRRDDYRDDINEMKGMLVRIFDKLDEKVDKP